MPSTRRDFVATGLAGLAGACAAGAMTPRLLLAGEKAVPQAALRVARSPWRARSQARNAAAQVSQ